VSHSPHSDSGSHSEATPFPLPDPQPVFAALFDGALGFGILKPEDLLKKHTPLKVLESIEDKERVTDIVHACTGMLKSIILARYDIRRFAEDIDAGIKADPLIAKRFIDALGVDYFLQCMEPVELYNVVMETLWMTRDEPATRGFAASLCNALMKHEAFGGRVKTLDHIFSAITIEALMSDHVPHGLRTRMFTATYKGARKYGSKHLAEYVFDKDVGGVVLIELAEHLPVEYLARPFAAYVDKLGITETQVDRPSVLPPSDHPAVAPPPMPLLPPTPKIPRPDPPPVPVYGPPRSTDGSGTEEPT
jgi:hypothetical protein